MKTAFLFPGQGAQHVGMGRDLYEAFPAARSVFDQAEAVTHLPLKKLCFQGPEEPARPDRHLASRRSSPSRRPCWSAWTTCSAPDAKPPSPRRTWRA